MRDVDADHHRFLFPQYPHIRWIQRMISAAQFEIEFQANVGEVLVIRPGKL